MYSLLPLPYSLLQYSPLPPTITGIYITYKAYTVFSRKYSEHIYKHIFMVLDLVKLGTYKRKTENGRPPQDVMLRAAKLVINNHQNKEFSVR